MIYQEDKIRNIMNNVLVLGGSGFVGSYLTKYFAQKEYRVSWVARNSGDYHIDFRSKVDYEAMFGENRFDWVICAINSYSNNLGESITNNVVSVANVLDCFEGKCSHIIFISSLSAEPENADGSVYAKTKYLAEEVVRYKSVQMKSMVSILRFSQIFDRQGAARNSQKGLYYFVDSIKNLQPITLYVQEEQKRSFMPIEVLCGVVEFALKNKIVGEHVATINPYLTLSELVDTLRDGTDYPDEFITKDITRKALAYHIPQPSKDLLDFLSCYESSSYLKRLVVK